MKSKCIIFGFLFLSVFTILQTNASHQENTSKSIIGTIIEGVKKQIENLLNLVKSVINKALEQIDSIKQKIIDITKAAINLALKAIDTVIDNTIGVLRKLAEDAIDAGIDVAECYVNKYDELNMLRRQLYQKEIACATDQLNAFNDIINEGVKTFTDDLNIVGGLPQRLADCMGLDMIPCVTKLITDIANLQQAIPKQILGTMKDITDYMITFEKKVHDCQFEQLRVAINETRETIDEVKYCIGLKTNATSNDFL